MHKTFTELGFKAGDTVICLNSRASSYKKGDEYTLMEKSGEIYTDGYVEWNGYCGDWKLKEKEMDKFKIGDKVEVIKGYDNYKIGDRGTITSLNGICYRINGDRWGEPAHYFKKVEDIIYEDQWHLNDGKVEIPGDADKLEKDGSVVAFRKRKAKPFEFGEKLRIKKSLWPVLPKVEEVNPGLDYVDAVYLSKYFDTEGEEGIKVYIENGENGWECCLIDLSKVERLT